MLSGLILIGRGLNHKRSVEEREDYPVLSDELREREIRW